MEVSLLFFFFCSLLLIISEPMSLLVVVEAFLIRRRDRHAFCLRLRARGFIGNLFLAFATMRCPTLHLFLLLLNHLHMIENFLNAILGCFKHPMHLSHNFLHAIHIKVYNERLIAHRERLENHVSSQVILEFTTKLVQSLKITHHLNHMRTDRVYPLLDYTETRLLRCYTSHPLLDSQTFHVTPKS
jgi:hypothetical protein